MRAMMLVAGEMRSSYRPGGLEHSLCIVGEASMNESVVTPGSNSSIGRAVASAFTRAGK